MYLLFPLHNCQCFNVAACTTGALALGERGVRQGARRATTSAQRGNSLLLSRFVLTQRSSACCAGYNVESEGVGVGEQAAVGTLIF